MKLTQDQEKVLQILSGQPIAKKFYWTGGTLLASQFLHHRLSFDLDFFSDTEFSHDELNPMIDTIKDQFQTKNIEESKVYDRWEFVLTDRDPELRFEFVHYNHQKKRIAPLGNWNGLMIDSLPDMAANKTMAYIDRNQPKDLLDIYALLTMKKFTVPELLDMVDKKFGSRFVEFMFWSESTKSLKRLEDLKPYLLDNNPLKQAEFLKDVEIFFLDHGREYFFRQIDG